MNDELPITMEETNAWVWCVVWWAALVLGMALFAVACIAVYQGNAW